MRTHTCDQHCSGIDLPAGDGQYTGARVKRLEKLHLPIGKVLRNEGQGGDGEGSAEAALADRQGPAE